MKLYRQAGNSIEVPVLKVVFRTIDRVGIERKGFKKTKALKKSKHRDIPLL